MKRIDFKQLERALLPVDDERIGGAYSRLREAIDHFAEETGHGLSLKIRPPKGSSWPRIEMTISAKAFEPKKEG